MTALGFIETKGLLAAIEAADAMLKAAEVRLLEKNLAGGGLVTISIAGEVAAVKAAVDAAVASIDRIPGTCLVSQHVIARPDVELAGIIKTKPGALPGEEKPAPQKAAPLVKKEEIAVQPPKEAAKQNGSSRQQYEISQLKKMSLNRLKELASKTDGVSLSKEAISTADKKALVEAITAAYRQTKE